jgi:hypothetical protein
LTISIKALLMRSRELQPAKMEEPDILPILLQGSGATEDENDTFVSFHRDMMDQIFPQVLSVPDPHSATENESATGSRSQVTASRAKTLLERYQALSYFTPYVQLPPEWTVESMLRSRPVLSLAIMVVMSHGHDSQRHLDTKLRQTLSQRILAQRQANLDILQGLLVYLGWFPMHLNPRRSGLFQFTQMMSTMVKDMRLDLSCSTLERKRSYAGACYFASLAAIPRRPNTLGWTDLSAKAVLDLAKMGELDRHLAGMATIQRLIDEIKPEMDDLTIENMVYRIEMVEPSNILFKSMSLA